MDMLSIQTSEHADRVKAWLDQEFETLISEGISVTWQTTDANNYTTLSCVIDDQTNALAANPEDICKYYVANALSDFILQELENKIISNMVGRKHKDLSTAEREVVEQQAKAELDSLDYNQRKTKILYTLLDYLDANQFLNIEGFVRFRLKDFCRQIATAIDKSLTELQVQKEYREFIRLLKYFVAMHEPKIPVAQVILRPNGQFRLLDMNNNVIDNDYLEGFAAGLSNERVDYEDLLLSALIVTAPATIILHLNPKWSVTQTILNIFEDRVTICSADCEYCRCSNEYMERLGLH